MTRYQLKLIFFIFVNYILLTILIINNICDFWNVKFSTGFWLAVVGDHARPSYSNMLLIPTRPSRCALCVTTPLRHHGRCVSYHSSDFDIRCACSCAPSATLCRCFSIVIIVICSRSFSLSRENFSWSL